MEVSSCLHQGGYEYGASHVLEQHHEIGRE